MADITLTLSAERWLDEVILTGASANGAGADVSDILRLPAGLGDVAIMDVHVFVEGIATIIADSVLESSGAGFVIVSASGATVVDLGAVGKWYRVAAARLRAQMTPDALVLWRQNEVFTPSFPELDTNVSPTGDITYYLKVVRVRPSVQGAVQPIRLVR